MSSIPFDLDVFIHYMLVHGNIFFHDLNETIIDSIKRYLTSNLNIHPPLVKEWIYIKDHHLDITEYILWRRGFRCKS